MKPFTINTYKKNESYLEERDMKNWVDRVQLLIYLVSFLDASIIGVAIWFILKSLSVNYLISLLFGILSFLIVFPAIIVIDVSISTFDTSNYYGATTSRISNSSNKIINTLSTLWKKLSSGISITIFIRTFLYFIVFIVSFQSLRFVFNELLQEANREALSKLKTDKETNFTEDIVKLQSEIGNLSNQMYKEASGTGDSKIKGIGPAYETLKYRKDELSKKLEVLKNTENKIVNIDSLATLPNKQLIKLFPNYKFISPPEIELPFQKKLFGNEPIYFHELIATLLSFILFASIIILKITGGERINKIYYNSALQDLYKDYITKNIHERHKKEIEDYSNTLSNNYIPSAESFYRWFVHQYPVTEREMLLDTLERVQNEKITYLDSLIERTETEKNNKFTEYQVFIEEFNTNYESYKRFEDLLKSKQQKITDFTNGIQSIDEAIKGAVDSEYIVNLTKSQVFQKESKSTIQSEVDNIENDVLILKNKNISIDDKIQLVKKLKEMDVQLFEALIAIKKKLIVVFLKQKLTLTKSEDSLSTYTEFIKVIIEFIDSIIESFNT